MRVSLVICFALFIVVVNCATQKTTLRRVVVNAGRGTTKAAKPKSAYAYLRAVRGKKSCVGGTCPFWERHGRSFASLRCYSQQYQECTCLHRMCFSSCMFEREVCNKEMVSCLQQICPRCMPVTSTAMCAVYDSMAERVAQALSVFACYPCCPNLINPPTNNTNAQGGGVMMMTTTTPMQSVNGGNTINVATSAAGSVNSMTTMSQNTGNAVNNGANQINGGSPSNANGSTNNFGGVFPGSGMMSSNNNIRNNSNSNSNNNAGQSQQIRQITRPTTRSTTRRVVTTRRTSAANTSRKPVTTTRRASNTTRRVMTTVGGNIIKITTRKPVQAPKKPQTNN